MIDFLCFVLFLGQNLPFLVYGLLTDFSQGKIKNLESDRFHSSFGSFYYIKFLACTKVQLLVGWNNSHNIKDSKGWEGGEKEWWA